MQAKFDKLVIRNHRPVYNLNQNYWYVDSLLINLPIFVGKACLLTVNSLS